MSTSHSSSTEPTIAVETGVIENFVQMLERVIPLLSNIKAALHESTAKIPQATGDLDDVNQATEHAAVEILNILENLGKRIDVTRSILNKLKVGSEYQQDLIRQISDRLKLENSSARITPELSTLTILLDKYLQATSENSSFVAIGKYLDDTKEDFLKITVALQVQDITSQQIEIVKKLVGSVQQQLILILKHFELRKRPGGAVPALTVPEVEESASALKAEQDIVDKIIEEWRNKQGKK